MLNLFNLKKNKNAKDTQALLTTSALSDINVFKKTITKHFPSPLREWKNSIYVYNKNGINLIPSTTVSVLKIIKNYFNLYNKNLESRMRTKRLLLRIRRNSSNKYYISKGEFKHTNNKVLINIFVYNRQRINYLLILKKLYLKRFLQKTAKNKNIKIKLIKRLKLFRNKCLKAVKKLNKNKYLLISLINKCESYRGLDPIKGLDKYTKDFYRNLIKRSLKKIKMYFFYKQLILINKSKLSYTYLKYLKKQLEKIYNKNVEFNFINIKRFYLNSDIFSESVLIKLSRNRKKLRKYFKKLKQKVTIRKKKSFDLSPKKPNLNPEIELMPMFSHARKRRYILRNLKYKHVTGFRLEAKGRLSKRFTASRSMHKLTYKGNLLNLDSSCRLISSVILKGNTKSNIQYTKLNSKSRIGSFGLKGWISGN